MIKKINNLFTSVPATLIGGLFLITSFILEKLNINLLVDPAWITVIISGLPLGISAVKKIIKNKGISKISSALLITVAMIAAIIIGDLFAAGEVAFIMAIGEILEDMTTDRAKKGLKDLISLAPVTARKITNGMEKIISADKICKKDILRVLPGETISTDGIIVSGETSVDQSIITGESLPVDKTVGDTVFCGTINRFGVIEIEATNVGSNSSLQKLIRMVKEAENKKAPMARVADKAASWLVPVALLIAIITGILTKNIVRAVTVLVVFCPCALVLATPTAIMAAIGQATKHGIIIKSGEALEKMGKVNTIAFDKTGTLTYGNLEVTDIVSFEPSVSTDDLLLLVASAEQKSEHPLGKAIVSYAEKNNIKTLNSSEFKMTACKGVFAKINEENIFCGNELFLNENGITVNNTVSKKLSELRIQGKASVICAINGKCIGIISLSDTVRPEAENIILQLKNMQTNSVLLTGDNKQTADYFAKKTGILKVEAELLPEEKVENIKNLQKTNVVCMIGDGVNDAPALKTANVGIAMGTMGSDIAVDAADIALMSDDLSKIPYLKRLSNATLKTIKASITLSMVINFVAVILSVLGVLNPTTGALVHNAGSCFVVLIAALLYDRKFE